MTGIIVDPQATSAHEVLHFAWANGWAVRKGDWKLITAQNRQTGKILKQSLHNLAEDKPEVKNHAREQPDIVKELSTLHRLWEKDLAAG